MEHTVVDLDEASNPFQDGPLRPRVDVFGLTVHDVVTNVGGWICDRGLMGWDIAVRLIDSGDTKPLRVLGASSLDRDSCEWSVGPIRSRGLRNTIAVSAEALALDSDLLYDVGRVLHRGSTTVMVWGESTDILDGESERQHYVMSCAAAAFKRQALTSMGAQSGDCEAVEDFYSLGGMNSGFAVEALKAIRLSSPGLRSDRM